LREGESIECVIKNKEENPWSIEQGSTRQKSVEEYSMVETDVTVPLEVTGVNTTFTVVIPTTGEELVIDERYVNMA